MVAGLLDSYAESAAGEQLREDADARGVMYSRHPATGAPLKVGYIYAGQAQNIDNTN